MGLCLKAQKESFRKRMISPITLKLRRQGESSEHIVEDYLKEAVDILDDEIGKTSYALLRSSYAEYALYDIDEFKEFVELIPYC